MNTASPSNPGLLNWLLILGLGVVWGTAFMSVSASLEGFGPWTVAAGRTGLAALVLVAGGALIGQGISHLKTPRAWGMAAAIGAGSTALPFLLLAWGQQHVPSAFAGVAMGAVPLLILPLVYVFSPEEGIGPRRIIGVTLGFVGLAVLIGPDVFDRSGSSLEGLGRLACVGATACYAVGSILTRRAPAMPPIALAAATMLVAACVLVPLAVAIEGVPRALPAGPTAALLYLALFPTALAAFLRVQVITTAGSLFMSLVSYMVPVWAVIFGVTLRSEALPPQLYIALAIILAGIGLSQWRSFSALWRR
ncbi:MAG: EamA family transporter [Rhodobacteraceae bacterium]|nr:EamA family transporter [Alphaproteobacteria bacterium]NNK65172.1 EamA family transporter [Paracoccaceae bacterium]